jgi:SEC-C motif
MYAWFLCTVVSLGVIQFPFHHLSIFLSRQEIPWVTPLDCIVAGMAFLYLAVNMAYLYELIPIPEKNQSWQDRMKQWHELTNLMTRRVEADQPTHMQSLLLLVGVGGALLLIYFFHWLPSGLAINILIVLPCLLSLGRGSSTAADALSQVANAHLPGAKVGRNDPCPCGNGKKFKHCCGAPGPGGHDAAG